MQMTTRQLKLLHLQINLFQEKTRKYNLEPYWFHLVRVAMRASEFGELLAEVGLCHDCVEDVKYYTYAHLTADLEKIGYTRKEVDFIVLGTFHLTDIYTKEAYPTLNRAERKKLEAERLWNIPAIYQNVKYSDLEDNTDSIVPYDIDFAKTYLPEKQYILRGMDKGNSEFYDKLVRSVNQHLKDL